MFLTEPEVQHAIAQAKASFPHLTDWEYRNEKDEEYFGFAVWGQFVRNPDDPMPQYFFITLDTYGEHWYGHLTIGQHCYLWSSADVGDAHLVDTASCHTLEEAIMALQMNIAQLCKAFSGS